MSNSKAVQRVAIIGTGVIGASWTALFLAKGLEAIATDIAPDAEAALRGFVKGEWPALTRLGLAPGAAPSKLTFTADLAAAVRGADFVQENGPERIDFKKKLYAQLDELLPGDVIIASSSSGLTMSEIQSACSSQPDRGHRCRYGARSSEHGPHLRRLFHQQARRNGHGVGDLPLDHREVMVLVCRRSPEQTDRPRNGGDGSDGESPSRTGDAKDAGKVIGRAGQNGRQAHALSPTSKASSTKV